MTVFVDLSLTVTIPLVFPNLLGSQSPGLTDDIRDHQFWIQSVRCGINIIVTC